jgi:quercetin dioxygenase-like cupin family protein
MSITFNKNRPAAKIIPQYQYALADNPEKTVVGLRIEYPPNGSTAPHRHGTASVIGYVFEGQILSGMNEAPAKTYKAGESWYEAPHCFHRVADNDSKTEAATVIATFVIDTEILEREGPGVLVQIDEKYAAEAAEQVQAD